MQTPPKEKTRSRNLRQLLLRAGRIVNRDVVTALQARGYEDLRATHTTLLSNMPLAGGTSSEIAERAGVTKQAMGRLAAELEKAGYIRSTEDSADGRSRLLELTDSGTRLMLDSFTVMASLENRYAKLIGRARLRAVRDGLRDFNRVCGGPDPKIPALGRAPRTA